MHIYFGLFITSFLLLVSPVENKQMKSNEGKGDCTLLPFSSVSYQHHPLLFHLLILLLASAATVDCQIICLMPSSPISYPNQIQLQATQNVSHPKVNNTTALHCHCGSVFIVVSIVNPRPLSLVDCCVILSAVNMIYLPQYNNNPLYS